MNKEFIERHWFKGGIIIVLLLAVWFGNNYLKEQNQLASQQVAQKEVQLQQEKDQKNKEFDASQKEACLGVYKQESSKWNNVTGWRYDAENDKCYIEYKEGTPKTAAQCDTQYKIDDKVMPLFIMDWLLCKEGRFEKSF